MPLPVVRAFRGRLRQSPAARRGRPRARVRSPDPKSVHLRLPPNDLDPPTLLPILRKLLTAAQPAESVV